MGKNFNDSNALPGCTSTKRRPSEPAPQATASIVGCEPAQPTVFANQPLARSMMWALDLLEFREEYIAPGECCEWRIVDDQDLGILRLNYMYNSALRIYLNALIPMLSS